MGHDLVLAADLGTSGCKAALYDFSGRQVARTAVAYATRFPGPGRHEQRPTDWWSAVNESFVDILTKTSTRPEWVKGIAISGQSLALVPLDRHGQPLLDAVPIWSDARAGAEASAFFESMSSEDWYLRTGNGFPAALYTLFKLLWLRAHEPEVFAAAVTVLGSKDYVNYRLTGAIATDPSYASGSGIYDIRARRYDPDIIAAAGLDATLWPAILPSSDIVGGLLAATASSLGLLPGTPVFAGGVDNACMALGARASRAGRIFCALGSSDWITVASSEPILDAEHRSYVFDHVVPGLYVSAESTFGGGSTMAWARDTLLSGLSDEAVIDAAASSVVGAHGLLCLPTVVGGTVAEGGSSLRGALLGLDIAHTRDDVARALLEGVAMALVSPYRRMARYADPSVEVMLVGGGSSSIVMCQIIADVLGVPIVTSSVDGHAATLGAATVALVGLDSWEDYARADESHEAVGRNAPDLEARPVYRSLLDVYERALDQQADLADDLARLRMSPVDDPGARDGRA